ncbi:MAG: hypothetical protein IT469_05020 [Pseudomonadales bacterium]|nr:hypothetical protein [Pseudomonadales bacterium]
MARRATRIPVWLTAIALASSPSGGQAAAFDIYQLPMFSSGAVTPNVMLLVDNSGSMDNIIWADDFDPTIDYPDWSIDWDPSSGNVHLSALSSSGCTNSTWYRGKKGSDPIKCLRLPDPVGGENTRYSGNYLNYLFETYAHNTNLTTGTIPNETRMQVAKQVATDLVNTVTGIRCGVSTFYGGSNNSAHGGTVLEACEDENASGHKTDLLNAIAGLSAVNNTPLAEALYEMTRYFRGMSRYYNGSSNYTSPLQYRCQSSFVVAVTDGYPTYDTTFPNDDPADTADTTRALPNWDNLAPATAQTDYPNFPQHSDGFQPNGTSANEGYSLYLDDIAKFAYDLDLKTSGLDLDGEPWGTLSDPPPPSGEPDFRQQRLQTYTVGFATGNQMLQDAAAYGDGQYYTANNYQELKTALEEALLAIQTQSVSAASVALNSTRLDTGLQLYQARFDSEDWSGDLVAFEVEVGDADNDGQDGEVLDEVWSARDELPTWNTRKIFTTKSSDRTGQPFVWASSGADADRLSTAQKNALKQTNSTNSSNTNKGRARVDYVRGDQSNEDPAGQKFRKRTHLLGDIVNSDPLFVGQQDFGYDLLPGTEGSSYLTFRSSASYTSRKPMVYVGANDGMLHGFDVSPANGGIERLAYIPLPAYVNLWQLSSPTYNHKFFVDGSPAFGDAYVGGAWKTILVGTLGGGGRGVFALDVTNPGSFSASNVLWEKVNIADGASWSPKMNIVDDSDIGYTYGQASVVRMKNGKWAAVFGNGYNSDGHDAALFIVDVADGSTIKKIVAADGTAAVPNGLSSPIPVDIDNDRIVDAIYAGDMRGNLWKFDVSGNGAGSWGVAFGGTPLFVATDPDGARQPITARPEVTKHPVSGVVVLFGTGKYFEETDRRLQNTEQTQTFYGVYDQGAAVTGGRAALLEQELIEEIAATDPRNPSRDTDNPVDLRVTTEQTPTVAQKGWYFDLPTTGERQIARPIVRDRRVIYTTVIPNDSACFAGGVSWLMEMDSVTGSRLPFSPFDLNNDQRINGDDHVEVTIDGQVVLVPVSGKKSNEGVIKTPGIVGAGDLEYKYTSGTTGGIEVTVEPGNTGSGRQSWRQLQ